MNQKMMLTDNQKENLKRMLANSFGEDTTKLYELRQLDPDIFPSDMAFERFVFEVLLKLAAAGGIPLPKEVIPFLDNDPHWQENGRVLLETLLGFSTTDGLITSYVIAFRDYQEAIRLRTVLEKGIADLEDGKVGITAAYDKLVTGLHKAAPKKKSFSSVGGHDLTKDWRKYVAGNLAQARAGNAIGPRLPFEATWEIVPFIKRKEVLIIEAISKMGKTNIMAYSADYIAHRLGGFDVLFCHLETDALTMHSRYMSRRMKIPFNYLEQGFYYKNGEQIFLDLGAPPWKELADKLDEDIARAEKTMGAISYFHCVGATPEDISVEIAKRKLLA